MDPANLPTIDEIRRLKKEFDDNSKSVENLIKLAKDSKLEKNLLQTIELKFPQSETDMASSECKCHLNETLLECRKKVTSKLYGYPENDMIHESSVRPLHNTNGSNSMLLDHKFILF